ncbi:stressosome-associated protein Prli42 [Bacillus licheniformis]|nr:stressosome-associated protein Prli42 [Bacillus licheniformis]
MKFMVILMIGVMVLTTLLTGISMIFNTDHESRRFFFGETPAFSGSGFREE